MQTTPYFDVEARTQEREHKLGRAWMFQKDGTWGMSIAMSSMPLPYQEVRLVNHEKYDVAELPAVYTLKVKIKKEGKADYWHTVGEVTRLTSGDDRVFEIVFASIPLSGDLVAFAKDGL